MDGWKGESVRESEKYERRNGENYIISSTVTYFPSFLLSSGCACVPASNTIYSSTFCVRTAYYFHVVCFWQTVELAKNTKNSNKNYDHFNFGRVFVGLDGTGNRIAAHRNTHAHKTTINTSVCGVTSRVHLTSRLRHYAEDSNFVGCTEPE